MGQLWQSVIGQWLLPPIQPPWQSLPVSPARSFPGQPCDEDSLILSIALYHHQILIACNTHGHHHQIVDTHHNAVEPSASRHCPALFDYLIHRDPLSLMARQPPSTPSNTVTASPFHEGGSAAASWDAIAAATSLRRSAQPMSSSPRPVREQNAYLMPTSPAKARRGSADYRPCIKKAVGNVPACLVNASVTYCGNDQIYAFGGFDQFTDEVYNHVLRLNLNTLAWDLVDNYGDIPGVRMGHTACLYEGTKLLVFGGENERSEYLSDLVILDIPSSTWTQPEVRGHVPRGRARHASVIYEDKLFVIGGVTGIPGVTGEQNNRILDDLCYLDLKTWTWSRTWSFTPRFDHTAWVWGGRLWIFGGLGPDMERTTDLWWLDLKGSPSLGSTAEEPQATLSHTTPSPGASLSPPRQLSSRSNGYAANSASVQIRSVVRRKPTAPGAISSLKFHSGPHVPSLLSGTHFHVYSSGLLLDLITPSETVRPFECNLSSLELDSLRWQRLADGQEVFRPGYRWHYCTINEDGTKAWLLGCNIEAPTGAGDDNQLNEILCLDLEKYGLLGNDLVSESSEQNRILASERQGSSPHNVGIGADLLAVFDQAPETDSGTDFIITAETDDHERDDESFASLSPRQGHSEPAFISPTASTSAPIHVHRIILQARWPHFKRLYAAQMAEYHTKRMHIPEPYSVVRAFLYYLYSDSILDHPEYCTSILDVAGMLVMANLYDMPKLRLLCVHRLSRELDVENAAIIWERAGRTHEEWLRRRAAQFCLTNWGRIVRTAGFKSLNRQSLIELCEVVDMEGRIIAGPELEFVGALGSGSLGSKRPRLTGNSLVDDMDELEGDDEDGMELS